MDSSSIIKFLENKTIFVTGPTGFLAKIFIEKVLRIQPNVKKLYLLLRAPDAKSATKRLYNEVLGKELFRVLREKLGTNLDSFFSEKVVAVAGDISSENLGVQDCTLKKEIWRNTDILLNFGATTKFDERYDVSLATNTFGALNFLNFAKKCHEVKMIIQVSSAYVCGERTGLILEKPFLMGEIFKGTNTLDIDAEKNLVDKKLEELRFNSKEEITLAMKELGMERANLYGWPNTYVFTKAMGEMLISNFKDDDLPLVIIRPSMISSTYKEPFPGWIEGLKTIDSFITGCAKGKVKHAVGDPETILDVIPADMVANAIIVAMVAHSRQLCDQNQFIYHTTSSLRNPLKLKCITDSAIRYFTENPLIHPNGNKPIKVGKINWFNNMTFFLIIILLPLKILYWLNIISCQYFKRTYSDLDRKVKFVVRMVQLYVPYVFFKATFDDTNCEKLRMMAAEMGLEMDEFEFDPKHIEWNDYFMNTHIPGLVRHAIK